MAIALRYRAFVARQHASLLDAWTSKDYPRALVELHFALTALNRTCDGLYLADQGLCGLISGHLATVDWALHRDAQNHFEHIDDRIYGSRRNAPHPIDELGAIQTIHFGLRESMEFVWSNHRIDVSTEMVKRFDSYVETAINMVDTHVAALQVVR